jgi:hypothetical protein
MVNWLFINYIHYIRPMLDNMLHDGIFIKIGKVSPQHARVGAKRERGYSSYSFTTSALDGGEWSASQPCCALHQGKGPPVPIGQKAGWAPEPVPTKKLEEKSSAGDRT